MRLSLRTKQVLGVTALVGVVVVVLSLIDLGQQARVRLEESQARGVLLAQAIYQRAFAIVPEAADPYYALREDGGMRNILEASIYSKGVTYAAIVDTSGIVIAHYDPEQIGKPLPDAPLLDDLVKLGGMAELSEIFFGDGRTYEVREPLKIGRLAGVTRIGISTLLVRNVLQETLQPVFIRALYLLGGATLGALLLAQWLLRPIHVLRSGLKRLERGEPAAALDLPQDEFGELGNELRAVSEKLLASREAAAGPQVVLDSIVENLADAVGIFGPTGDPLFVNPALRSLLHASERDGSHPFRELVDRTLDSRLPAEPTTMTLPEGETGTRDWQVSAYPVNDKDDRLLGVMVLARDLEALGAVESTIRYSRKLAALGRLTAGVAHEVKNPLNAMTIHLELLKGKLSLRRTDGVEAATAGGQAALEHVGIIGSEIRRLDQVVQGFLKFMRPEDLQPRPVPVQALLSETARIVEPDAAANGVRLQVDCPPGVPDVQGDPGSLRQALLNLALNACQAMAHGGTLRLTGRGISRRRVAITVEDTGAGIHPDHMPKVFDLYFTTKQGGSGIGLSMVYRTVQLHDGEIEVQSTLGKGTTFRIVLPQA